MLKIIRISATHKQNQKIYGTLYCKVLENFYIFASSKNYKNEKSTEH